MKILKRLALPLYLKFIDRLKRDIYSDEQLNLLKKLDHQSAILQDHIELTHNQIGYLNKLISGIDLTSIEDDFFMNPADVVDDVFNILTYQESNVTTINRIAALDSNLVKGKKACVIGVNNLVVIEALKKRGVKAVISIELSPYISKDVYTKAKIKTDELLFIYPTKLPTIPLSNFDILVSLNPAVNSYILKYKMFHLGAHTKELAILTIQGNDNSFKILKSAIHTSGFTEITTIEDKSITHFDYETIHNIQNTQNKKDTKDILQHIFLAHKLPSMK